MPSIASAGRRFETLFALDPSGMPFAGTIFPAEEGSVPSYDFTQTRLLLRVQPDAAAHTGDVLVDLFDRRFLLADHDVHSSWRVHRLFQMTHRVTWSRVTSAIDPVTRLPKGTGQTTLGPIWCAIEAFGREEADRGMLVKEQTRRLITGAPIQLGDKVDDMIVKRLDRQLGIWVAEIQ